MENIQKEITEVKNSLLANSISNKEVLNLKEACRFLDLSKSSLYKLTSKKEIPHYKPSGRKIYFKKIELIQWIEKGKVATISDEESKQTEFLNRNSQNLASC